MSDDKKDDQKDDQKDKKVFSFEEEKDKRTIYRVIKDKNNPYVQINKTVLLDKRLSWKAKGLHVYMLSMPDDWVFHRDEMVMHAKDGRDSLLTAIDELEKYGYLAIAEERVGGRFSEWKTHVYETPNLNPTRMGKSHSGEKPNDHAGFTRMGKTTIGKTTIGKSDATNNNNNKNDFTKKETTTTNELIETQEDKENKIVIFDVVVSLKEMSIESEIANRLANEPKNTKARVGEVIRAYLALGEKTTSPGWIIKALDENWVVTKNPIKASNIAQVKRKSFYRADNIVWWGSLLESQKIELYEKALIKYPYLANQLEDRGIKITDFELETSFAFGTLMDVLGRPEK